MNRRSFAAEHLGRGLHRIAYQFQARDDLVVAKLQISHMAESRRELEACNVVKQLRSEHVPMFNKNMFTVSFSGHSLSVLLVEYVACTGADFVRALLQEHESFDNRTRLARFMVQLVELIVEVYENPWLCQPNRRFGFHTVLR